ncbi:hypothetical protein A2U01_0081594, partial [Trifolium medium]|nr:hypothetical protein [Trifolium medium]
STAATGGEIAEVVQSPSKKCKISTIQQWRKLALTPGATAVVGELGDSDRNIPAADKDVNTVQPSSSQTAPATASGTAPSLWDPLFNPMA